MICPMEKGAIRNCAVQKQCGGPLQVQINGAGSADVAKGLNKIMKNVMKRTKLLVMLRDSEGATRACASQCGFY